MRPWRIGRIVFNALRGHETSKLETFLVDMIRRRKGFMWLKNLFSRKIPEASATT